MERSLNDHRAYAQPRPVSIRCTDNRVLIMRNCHGFTIYVSLYEANSLQIQRLRQINFLCVTANLSAICFPCLVGESSSHAITHRGSRPGGRVWMETMNTIENVNFVLRLAGFFDWKSITIWRDINSESGKWFYQRRSPICSWRMSLLQSVD